MNCLDIIRAYLRDHGYGGLCNSYGECACSLKELRPCEQDCMECEPGHYVPSDGRDGFDFHIVRDREAGVVEEGKP